MADTDERWADGQSGEFYAVRMDVSCVAGHDGPLGLVEVETGRYNRSPYGENRDPALNTHREWRGEEVVPRPQPGGRVLSRTLGGTARRRQTR
jgi:hypothetical protein